MSEAVRKAGPFASLTKTDCREQLTRVLDASTTSGLPCTYLSIGHTTVNRGNGRPLERLLLDFAASDIHGELDERHIITARDGSASVDTSRKTFYRSHFANAEAVLSVLAGLGLTHLCDRTCWYANEELVTDDWNYWLDPSNVWPLWTCSLGCDLELSDGGPPGRRGEDSGLPNDVSWAAKVTGQTIGLMPFVGIRLTAMQMERAEHEHILNLFDELPDSTGFTHPTREMEGGAIEASREFAIFAKRNPQRAVDVIGRLSPNVNELPAGLAIEALADTDLMTSEIIDVITACQSRGFQSESFRTHAADALGKRAAKEKGLPGPAVQLLREWLAAIPVSSRSKPRLDPDHESGDPPFLYGIVGGYSVPRGSYTILDTLLVALLSPTPARSTEWLSLLKEHLSRDEDPLIWKVFANRLQWLQLCDADCAGRFVEELFTRYPEVLESLQGTRLVAHASWWVKPEVIESWMRTLETSAWKHSQRAMGELAAFLATRDPPVLLAQPRLERILAAQDFEQARVGAASVAVEHLQEPPLRAVAAQTLVVLISRGEPPVDEVILRRLEFAEGSADEFSLDLVRALARRESNVASDSVPAALAWVRQLVHADPGLVHEFVSRVLSDSSPSMVAALSGGAKTLVDVALTLQRMPGYLEKGLAMFEDLLERNLYGVRDALDEIDQMRT